MGKITTTLMWSVALSHYTPTVSGLLVKLQHSCSTLNENKHFCVFLITDPKRWNNSAQVLKISQFFFCTVFFTSLVLTLLSWVRICGSSLAPRVLWFQSSRACCPPDAALSDRTGLTSGLRSGTEHSSRSGHRSSVWTETEIQNSSIYPDSVGLQTNMHMHLPELDSGASFGY